MTERRIYTASSWRNPLYPSVVAALRADGHELYDFRTDGGFHWSNIDPGWGKWTPEEYVEHMQHPIAKTGFACDKSHLDWANTTVLILPCGKSAHLELGYAAGLKHDTFILLHSAGFEPELMYGFATQLHTSLDELRDALRRKGMTYSNSINKGESCRSSPKL